MSRSFQRIDKVCTPIGVKYEFLREEYGFTVRFHRHSGTIWEKDKNADQALSGKGPEKGPRKGPESKEDEMAARSDAILTVIKNDPTASRPTLAKELNLTEKQVRTAIERLKSAGIIHYEGIGKNGHWIID